MPRYAICYSGEVFVHALQACILQEREGGEGGRSSGQIDMKPLIEREGGYVYSIV